jgi:2-succinyl-5-enolpyruvyl-6-hydroxy-3-cyclohexene-1-carboxylate synthase
VVFGRDRRFKLWMHLDERSGAFFALGLARKTAEPVAIVCTSGTAAANCMPAVVEARMAQVPLLVLTADRPPELRDVGAPQTIDQIRFYGAQVKWSVEMATPAPSADLLRYARTTACRAVATSAAAPAGPVHLNFPFREPLTPVAIPGEFLDHLPGDALFGRHNSQPYARVEVPNAGHSGAGAPSGALWEGAGAAAFPALAARLLRARRGLIVAGPMRAPGIAEPLARLAGLLGYPILADPLSGLRAGRHDRSLVLTTYDAFLRDEHFITCLVPEVVIRFGAMPTSKPVLQYLQRYPAVEQILVVHGGWPDSSLLVSHVIESDVVDFCRVLATTIDALATTLPVGTASTLGGTWVQTWVETDRRAGQALAATLGGMQELFEGRVFAELAELLPDGATLLAGNSMPVRDLDSFFPGTGRAIDILANRGANGIDGVVSTALGVAAAGAGPTVLAIGDISLYHDMNGLLAARQYNLDLTIVLLNNDGGGIFSFLPQATTPLVDDREDATATDRAALFETLFGTPHGLEFRHVAALYGATYSSVAGWTGFREAVRASIAHGGLHLVEVPTDRARNVVLHRRCWPAVAEAIHPVISAVGDARAR